MVASSSTIPPKYWTGPIAKLRIFGPYISRNFHKLGVAGTGHRKRRCSSEGISHVTEYRSDTACA